MPYKDKEKERAYNNRPDIKAKKKATNKAWRIANAEKVAMDNKKWREEHPEEYAAYQANYRATHKESRKLFQKEWSLAHPGYHTNQTRKRREITKEPDRLYRKKRLQNDPHFRATSNMRRRIRLAIKNGFKSGSSKELLGASFEDVRAHLERLFLPGMTWENYGQEGWVIDHKIPCASFDLRDPTQQKLAFNYKNLQPLWKLDNLSKGAKLEFKITS